MDVDSIIDDDGDSNMEAVPTDDSICDFLYTVLTPDDLKNASQGLKANKRKLEILELELAQTPKETEIHDTDEEDAQDDSPDSDADEIGFNIEKHEAKITKLIPDPKKTRHNGKEDMVKVELPPFLDPARLVCKDTIKYPHLAAGSGKLPQSNFNIFDFPSHAPRRPEITDRNSFHFDVHDVLVNLDIRDSRLGIFGTCKSKDVGIPDAATIEAYPFLSNAIFRGLPVRSHLYTYSLRIYRKKNADWDKFWTYMGRSVWWVESYDLTRQPLCSSNLRYFVEKCAGYEGGMAVAFEGEFNAKFPNADDNDSTKDFNWSDYEQIVKRINRSKNMHDRPIPEVLRYVFCAELSILREFYKDLVLLNMNPRHLQSLCKRITSDAFDLFFFKMTPFLFRITKTLKDAEKYKKDNDITSVTDDQADGTDMTEGDDDDDQARESELRQHLDQLTFNRDLIAKTHFNFDLGLEVFWVYIPEIDNSKVSSLSNMFTQRQLATINIYQGLRRSYTEDFHLFEYPYNLKSHIKYAAGEDLEAEFDSIMNWLCTTPLRDSSKRIRSSYRPTLVKCFNNVYYMDESYLHTKIVIESMMLLFDRYTDRVSLDMDPTEKYEELRKVMGIEVDNLLYTSVVRHMSPLSTDIDVTKLNEFCSEQLKGTIMFRDSPFVLITGGGGSGKSTWIEEMARVLPEHQCLLMSFTGKNVFQHSHTFGPRAMTLHKALYSHKKCCVTDSWSTSNAFRRNKGTDILNDFTKLKEHDGIPYKRCIFEEIKYVFYEEASMISLELFAETLLILLRCSQLERVIVVGDHRQCPSIGPGNLMKDLKNICDEMGVTVEFTHNHRTGNEVLHNNAQAIARGDVDSLTFDDISSINEEFQLEYSKEKKFEYGMKVVEILDKYDIQQSESGILAHTNNIVDSINPVVEGRYLGKFCNEDNYLSAARVFHVGSKVMFKMNFYLKGNILVNNEVGEIIGIEDFQPLEKKEQKNPNYFIRSLSNNAKVCPVGSTSAPRSFSRCRRRLIIRDINHVSNEGIKYIPFFGMYRNKVKKANAKTIQGAQGEEHLDVVIVMPFVTKAWTREMVYTAFTRAKRRIIFLGYIAALIAAINNPEPDRHSELSVHVLAALKKRVPEGWRRWQPIVKYDLYNELLAQEELMAMEHEQDLANMPRVLACGSGSLCKVFSLVLEHGADMPFQLLPDVYNLKRVCKAFSKALDSKEMWLELYAINYKYTSPRYSMIMDTPEEIMKECSQFLDGNKYRMCELADYVLSSIGTSIARCKNCKSHYILNSATIIAAFNAKFATKEAKARLPTFDRSKDEHDLVLQLQLCPCIEKLKCNIKLQRDPQSSVYRLKLGGYFIAYGEILDTNSSATRKRLSNRLDISALRYSHPAYRYSLEPGMDISGYTLEQLTGPDTIAMHNVNYSKTYGGEVMYESSLDGELMGSFGQSDSIGLY